MKSACFEKRSQALRRLLKAEKLDAYITLSTLEQRYLSGAELLAGEAVFVVTRNQTYCITKQMIAAKIAAANKNIELHLAAFGSILRGALILIKQKKLKSCAFDGTLVSLDEGQTLLSVGAVRKDGLLLPLRAQKDADEIAKIKRACKIASDAFAEVKPKIKTGMSEEDVRVMMATAMVARGANGIPFNIVCFGENGADAHHMPSAKRKLKAEDAVLMDFGCFYQGYVSDMTRSWWHGKKVPAEYTKIWNIVDKARKNAVKMLKAGVSAGDVDKAARDIIEAQGYGKEFFHTTGHGVGLYVHEEPFLRKNSPKIVPVNAAVTVEPGIYLDGKFGVRLEDTFLVTKTGRKKLTY